MYGQTRGARKQMCVRGKQGFLCVCTHSICSHADLEYHSAVGQLSKVMRSIYVIMSSKFENI